MQSFDATVVERLDTLFSSLLEKLEMLKTTARALADYEASLEGQIRSIDTIQPNHQQMIETQDAANPSSSS